MSEETPRRRRPGCLGWILIVAVLFAVTLFLVGRCTLDTFNSEMADELGKNPVIQEHLGEIQELSTDWRRTFAPQEQGKAGNGMFFFEIDGSKADGVARVLFDTQAGQHVTIISGYLEIDGVEGDISLVPESDQEVDESSLEELVDDPAESGEEEHSEDSSEEGDGEEDGSGEHRSDGG